MNSNFRELFTKAREVARVGVQVGQGPVMAMVLSNPAESSLATVGLFLRAFSGVNNTDAVGWISARGLMSMADHYFHNDPEFRVAASHIQESLYSGAITALWVAVPRENPALTTTMIVEAWSSLIHRLRRIPPSYSAIKWTEAWQGPSEEIRHNCMLHWFPLTLSSAYSDALITRLFASCNGISLNCIIAYQMRKS